MIKRSIMFLAALYLLLGISLGAFAHDVYNTATQDKAYIDCQTYSYWWKTKHKRVSGTAWFTLKNDTATMQTVNYSITVCPPGAPCKTNKATGHLIPWAMYHSPAIAQFTSTDFCQYGVQSYKVSIDVTGYKNLHTEKECQLIMTR